jgi:DNA-binding transcriptional MocR family regulator
LTIIIDVNIDNDKFTNTQQLRQVTMAYFPPRQTNTKSPKSGAAFDALKRDIMLGVLEPGTGLTELELAAHFQCSQGTVREALLQLQEEGLVLRDVSAAPADRRQRNGAGDALAKSHIDQRLK